MIIYLPLLLVLITVPLYAAFTAPMNMTYSMEKGQSFQSICGRNVLMPVNGYKHKLVSMFGNAGGNCFATLMLGLTSKLTCKICVNLEGRTNWILDDDIMNISFTGEAKNILLKYGHANLTETCFHGRRLDILVVEDEGYARTYNREKPPHYSFNFALKPECSKEPIPICKCPNTMDGDIKGLSIGILVVLFIFLLLAVLLVVDCYNPSRKILNWRRSRRRDHNALIKTPEGADSGVNQNDHDAQVIDNGN